MTEQSIVLDVWEGNLESNETEYSIGGVAGLIIRINDTLGGLHMDANFVKQWNESKNFYPAPYFVYNPWVDGATNFVWLNANIPPCPAVFIDVELRYGTPERYGIELAKFIVSCKSKWHTIIYSGAGFIDMVKPWPAGMEYWWAQWPYPLYPSSTTPVTNISWTDLRSFLSAVPWPPANASKCPGVVKLHQCSGDRFIVPGNTHVMDVSIFPGSPQQYASWLGYGVVQPPVYTLDQRVTILEREAKIRGWNLNL
jgi:hypothetical protein